MKATVLLIMFFLLCNITIFSNDCIPVAPKLCCAFSKHTYKSCEDGIIKDICLPPDDYDPDVDGGLLLPHNNENVLKQPEAFFRICVDCSGMLLYAGSVSVPGFSGSFTVLDPYFSCLELQKAANQ